MGGEHDVCHYVCNCSSFKASALLHLCCSAQLSFVKILSVFFALHMLLFFTSFKPLSSLDLILYTSQTCQNLCLLFG